MAIISEKDFASATKLDRFRMPGLTHFLMELMKINEINEIYESSKEKEGVDFIDAVLNHIGIHLEIDETELKNIPTEGAFIAVANHPYGGIEGLILLKIICEKRPDFKVMANFLLKKIPNLADFFIAVNPFENLTSVSSIAGIKQTLEMIQKGTPIGIFPAGEVSTYKPDQRKIIDKEWHPVVGKIIAKSNVPVLPVYFHGNNGVLFNVLSLISPSLRTARLPSEFVNKEGKTIKVRIGKPVSQKELSALQTSDRILKYVRAKTYAIGSGIEVHRFYSGRLFTIRKKAEEIVAAIAPEILEQEITAIREKRLIITEKDYEVFVAPASEIKNVLYELGRLREITFREIGEGTNKSIDLDDFDIYYNHLFIWDKVNSKIVGAYRIGKGDDIYERYGKRGFYISTLFTLKRKFSPILKESLELGRSIIVKEYQLKPLPLMLLWKGILLFLVQNKKYRYLIGPVSISNNFSKLSKTLIIDFFQKNYFDQDLAKLVRPKHKFRVRPSIVDKETLLEASSNNIKSLDALISDIELDHSKMPVLLRQYVSINARLIAFNVDPKFSDALDGFIVMDLKNIPEETVRMLSKDSQSSPIL